jgi:TolB protein
MATPHFLSKNYFSYFSYFSLHSIFSYTSTFFASFAIFAILKSLGCIVLFSFFTASTALAQFRVDVTGIGLTQVPVSIAAFKGEASSIQKISVIVAADLSRSGQFRLVDAGNDSLDENSQIDISAFRQKAVDAMAAGSVTRLADGRYDVRFRLWDVVKGANLGGASHTVTAPNLRLAAHKIADYIYEKLTGEKGVFSTKIAYISKAGARHTLWVADADGENAITALASTEPIISPSWSPNGAQLAYVSFENRKPEIWVHEVATGKRRLLASFKGSNSAPSWSPDGRYVVLTLSRDGNAQIYALSTAGGEPTRLSRSEGIDTEATYSADGRSIYFVSDRGGAPQIYRMSSSGGSATRVTFAGNYNISPSLSPDGRWLAYISRSGGGYKLYVMDLSSGVVNAITETNADERPSFSANSKLIVYATKVQGREALMTTTVDGRIKARLGGVAGDIREPAWSPVSQ